MTVSATCAVSSKNRLSQTLKCRYDLVQSILCFTPNDNGYDIADYRNIDPRFGTMADFEELVAKLKAINIDVMLDMVLNHTSTEHAWFQKALAGDPKYQAYYYIRPGKADGSLPTNWESKFGGPAWAPFGDTGNYYLHLYDPTQADLDWHNPAVRQEAAAIVNFWRAKGVHGFRFDVLNVIGKSETLVDAPPQIESKTLYTDTPIVEDYIKELAANSFDQDDNSVTVGEMSSTDLPHATAYTKPENHELSMVFQFHHLKTDYQNGEKWTNMRYDFNALRDLLHKWGAGMSQSGGWQALFWNNHDQPRALDRFGEVSHYRIRSAQVLAASIHLSRGTPYIYMGEEIGMSDPQYTSMDDYVDIEAHNAYKSLLQQGLTPEKHLRLFTKRPVITRGPRCNGMIQPMPVSPVGHHGCAQPIRIKSMWRLNSSTVRFLTSINN